MNQTIHYVTGNPMKRRTVERLIRQHAPHLRVVTREASFHEPQTLDENQVIEYKAGEAWQTFQRPLIVDDAGFYIEEFSDFPGPLAKPTVMTLGWDGMLRLAAPSYRAKVYCRLGYVDANGKLLHFRGETSGKLDVEIPPSLVERRGVYALLRPDNSTRTMAEMASTGEADLFSPRAKAIKAFIEHMISDANKPTT